MLLIPPTEADIAYAAGQFDARGYIRIGCQKGRTPRLTVYIRMTKPCGQWFARRWEGVTFHSIRSNLSVNAAHVTVKKEGGVALALMRVHAQRFLTDIHPYAQYRQAFIGKSLEFLERVLDQEEKSNPNLLALVDEIREIGLLKW